MNKINFKKGNTAITIMISFLIITVLLIIIGYTIINLFIPFIYYQKLDTISNKYLFVIEKFGYLTSSEKNNLINDLENQGFNTEEINIIYPATQKSYGELIEFTLEYNVINKSININNGIIGLYDKETKISVRKNSFSKLDL